MKHKYEYLEKEQILKEAEESERVKTKNSIPLWAKILVWLAIAGVIRLIAQGLSG